MQNQTVIESLLKSSTCPLLASLNLNPPYWKRLCQVCRPCYAFYIEEATDFQIALAIASYSFHLWSFLFTVWWFWYCSLRHACFSSFSFSFSPSSSPFSLYSSLILINVQSLFCNCFSQPLSNPIGAKLGHLDFIF